MMPAILSFIACFVLCIFRIYVADKIRDANARRLCRMGIIEKL